MTSPFPADFTHLRVHSHYSLLRGTASVEALVQRAADDGLHHLALTDTHALYGAVAFGRACAAAGLHPIIGMVIPIAPLARSLPLAAGSPGDLVLLAQNPAGYRSLCRLSSLLQAAPERNDWQQHGLPWTQLKENGAGLICIGGGRNGWSSRYLRAGERRAAAHVLSRLGGIFQENAYIGVALDTAEDASLARDAVALGARFGLRPVAVQPVYCLQPAEREQLRLLAAIRRNCPLAAVADEELPPTGHWRSPEEMAADYADFPQALATVGHIVGQCEPSLPAGETIWPALDLPAGQTPEEALRRQAETGLVARYGDEAADPVRARLQQELAAIERAGFAPFFLLVADVVRFARRQDIPTNTRGSVANSLVAYCLGITTVDPVAHDLLFARFLTPARASLPDIDLDVCSRRRDELLRYVRDKYGADRVALVATISTMGPKSAVAETAKAYGLGQTQRKRLSSLVPGRRHPDPRRRAGAAVEEIVAQLEDEPDREIMAQVAAAALALVGRPHHLSIHPGGVVVTPTPLTDLLPLQMAPKGFATTQYPHDDLEAIGLPKLDLLGIRALTVLADTAALVRRHHDPEFRLDAIPPDDAATASLLRNGETIGVFQCESTGARRTLRQLEAETVADLAVANAFFKPGPATGGMARSFIRRYRGEEPVTYLHPALEPILAPTQGVLLFQEQILRVATEIAGLSWAQADGLRKGMSKFQAREMAALRTDFERGCREQSGFTTAQAETLWQQVAAFAGYGFNRGHATAYADVSYRSAYLKAHWPAPFLCARLAGRGGFHHPAVYVAEAQRLGIAVRPPHVNVSGRAFTLTYGQRGPEGGTARGRSGHSSGFGQNEPPGAIPHGPCLWMGLGAVRDLRRSAVGALVANRPFSGLADLLSRVDLRAKEIRHLIQCGALAGLGASRAALLAEAQTAVRAGSARQLAFAFARETGVPPETARQRVAWELHIIGQPLSVHPVTLGQRPAGTIPLAHLPDETGKNKATTAATTVGVRLPGWTGGDGFFLGDGRGLVVVQGVGKSPLPLWQPFAVTGRWRRDEWGGGWFQAETIQPLADSEDSEG